jgi:hypothetical protein
VLEHTAHWLGTAHEVDVAVFRHMVTQFLTRLESQTSS